MQTVLLGVSGSQGHFLVAQAPRVPGDKATASVAYPPRKCPHMREQQMTVQVDSAVALGPGAQGRAGAQGVRGPGAQALRAGAQGPRGPGVQGPRGPWHGGPWHGGPGAQGRGGEGRGGRKPKQVIGETLAAYEILGFCVQPI